MEKNFAEWHGVKQDLQDSNKRWFYAEREVRWCSTGLNVGSEMDGKGKYYTRPVLIVKKISRNTCLCIPLTKKEKHGSHYLEINLKDGIKRTAVLSQLRLIDAKRLWGVIGTVDKDQFQKIKRAIIGIIE